MLNLLKQLEITEASSVRSGANPGARILLIKRDLGGRRPKATLFNATIGQISPNTKFRSPEQPWLRKRARPIAGAETGRVQQSRRPCVSAPGGHVKILLVLRVLRILHLVR